MIMFCLNVIQCNRTWMAIEHIDVLISNPVITTSGGHHDMGATSLHWQIPETEAFKGSQQQVYMLCYV